MIFAWSNNKVCCNKLVSATVSNRESSVDNDCESKNCLHKNRINIMETFSRLLLYVVEKSCLRFFKINVNCLFFYIYNFFLLQIRLSLWSLPLQKTLSIKGFVTANFLSIMKRQTQSTVNSGLFKLHHFEQRGTVLSYTFTHFLIFSFFLSWFTRLCLSLQFLQTAYCCITALSKV